MCISGGDRKLCFNGKDRGNVFRGYMERIMNEENDENHCVKGDAVEGPVFCVRREKVLLALNEMHVLLGHEMAFHENGED